MTNSNIIEWAAERAAELLTPLGNRWLHTQGVVKKASQLLHVVSEEDRPVLIAAAYLHDIGYAPSLQKTGFHPLDGAYYLLSQNQRRLASLVAYHSGAEFEAQLRDLTTNLQQIPRECSIVADALTYSDLLTGPKGSEISFDERLTDIFRRYDEKDIVNRAIHQATPSLEATMARVRALLSEPTTVK